MEEYIHAWIEHGCKFVRIDSVYDYDLTERFCHRMAENDIITQLTLADNDIEGHGDYREHVRRLKRLPIIFEANNEFMNRHETIQETIDRVKWMKDQGVIVSAGAWGYSHHGKEYAEEFRSKCDEYDIEDIHRGPYPPLNAYVAYIEEIKDERKNPILCGELLDEANSGVPADQHERYIKAMIKAGSNGVNMYNDKWELAGKLCEEFNEKNVSTIVSN